MPLSVLLKYRKSYRAGLLQAKAFRILKRETNAALAEYNLNATDWGILGLLSDNKDGLAFKDIAHEMGVKPPFITRSVRALAYQNLVTTTTDENDHRSKKAHITKEGTRYVNKIEKHVMDRVLKVLKPAGKRNVQGYVATLDAIVSNYTPEAPEALVDLSHMND